MHAIQILSRSGNDCCARYKCEFCGATKEGYLYSDFNFEQNVVRNMECDSCGKSTNNPEINKES